jgi:NAD(P)H-dependent FMN reductase
VCHGAAAAPDEQEEDMLEVGIIIGSTRPNRVGESVGRWVHEHASKRSDAKYQLIDLKEVNLPLLDEPVPPSMGKYSKDHTKRWAARVAPLDAFVFVTPEYNHGTSGALKNAIDFIYAEWNDKAAAFVSYGSAGGVRAVENLRLVLAECQVATVRSQVMLSLRDDFESYSTFKPRPHQEKALGGTLDQLIKWGTALRSVRQG